MLGKHYSLGSVFEETGEARVKLANFDDLKSQGEDIASFLSTFKPDSGFVYLHVIAMGAGEYYGCNINGDYFPEKDLIERHRTFVTTAKVFKEHDNKPYSPDYGHVAFSWYNPKMHRVELILAVDKVKGKEFIDRQARGEQLEVSMGCKVAFDVCSICGNKAKRRDEYCNHIRHDKKKIYPDGKQPYMINYNPTFFDISIVKRRADRIAYVLDKVASAEYSENGISFHKADEFEHLDQSCIPFAPPPERAVFDWEDEPVVKSASTPTPTLAEKIAMIKRINADAVRVLNKGVAKAMPELESVEPDLPVSLLDRIASKYSIPDILKSFIVSAIPMKPREFTRIIIVNQGLPLESYNDVLRGILKAKATELPAASSQNEVLNLLTPFLSARSSFLPAIMERIDKLMKGKEKTAAMNLDPMNSYYGLNPNIQFGHVRNQPSFNTIDPTVPNRAYVIHKNPMASLPIVISPEAYARSMNRPQLRMPDLDPEKTGLILGGMYLASRAMPNIAEVLKQYPELPIAAAIASLYYAKTKMDEPDVLQKKAMIIQPTPEVIGKYALPFVAAHLASAHLRGAHNNGAELNSIEKFVAEHPDILSILAPLAIGLAMRKHANIKIAGFAPTYHEDANDEKIAYFADVLADIAMLG